MNISRCLPEVVRRYIERLIERRLNSRIPDITGLVPITQFDDDDVFIVGYPKSGNTWVQNLVTGIIYGANPEYAPDTLVQELVPDIHYKRYYKRYGTPMFFKSHNLPRREYKRVIYLLRDGRDAMVSYFHFLTALQDKVDFLRMVESGEGLPPSKWHEHVKAWLSNPYGAEMIVIKYENLKSKPIDELRKFCDFLCIKREDGFLNQVITSSSFAKMHQKEKKLGWDNPAWPKDKFFVRRGMVGSYKDEMPPDVLENFLSQSREMLDQCGYLDK